MPMAGKGMLLTSMDIDASDEADFNRWYDREHLEERVAIEGFLEARRYVADKTSHQINSIAVSPDGSVAQYSFTSPEPMPKYLCLYSTETIDVFNSAAYKVRLANPTEWSTKTMARFRNMIRAVARITISRGNGRGAALGIIRLRPTKENEESLRSFLADALDPKSLDGTIPKSHDNIISMHLIENDPALSGPAAGIPSASTGAGDWFVLIDATDVSAANLAVSLQVADKNAAFRSAVISSGTYRLMWDLAKRDIPV
jgi:hypothetical protein